MEYKCENCGFVHGSPESIAASVLREAYTRLTTVFGRVNDLCILAWRLRARRWYRRLEVKLEEVEDAAERLELAEAALAKGDLRPAIDALAWLDNFGRPVASRRARDFQMRARHAREKLLQQAYG